MLKKTIGKVAFCMIVAFQLMGCASMQKQSQSDVLNQNDLISQLNKIINTAKENEVNNYAPKGFLKADALLKQSIELAQTGKNEKAFSTSKQGLTIINQAQKDAKNVKKELWELREYRTRAVKAGAPELYKEDFESSEKMFREIASYIEIGEVEKAKQNQPKLIEKYSTLERNSLEKGIIELAKVSFKEAKQAEADKYAPKSYKNAQKELGIALSIVEADSTRTEQANRHAETAAVQAGNAEQISTIVKTFKRRDFSNEDIVLWYWKQLEIINGPFGDTLNFQQSNNLLVNNIKDKIINLQLIKNKQEEYILTLKTSNKNEVENLNNQLSEIQKKYKIETSEQQKSQAKKDRLEKELKQRFAFVQSLFDKNEAQVFRKGDNILISAHGFYFPTGKSEIESSNFGLLNKILSSIKQFPNAQFQIDGHTDAVGSADLNLRLSDERAKKVAEFITNVGQIEADRITIKGYGDTKPVASNKSKEGRIKNRRIEVNIIND